MYLLGFLRRTLYMTSMWPVSVSNRNNYVINTTCLLFLSRAISRRDTTRHAQMDRLLDAMSALLQSHETAISTMLIYVLTGVSRSSTASLLLDNLLLASHDILVAFRQYPVVNTAIRNTEERLYSRELQALTRIETGWHFSALHATADQIEDFHLEDMATQMEAIAPTLWRLLDVLVLVNASKKRALPKENEVLDEDEEGYWDALDGLEDENLISRSGSGVATRRASRRVVEKRRADIRRIVSWLTHTCSTKLISIISEK